MKSAVSRTVPASCEQVWERVADHEGMSQWAPGLTVRLDRTGGVDRNGVGAVRRIELGPMPAIVEEITAFDPQSRLAYKALSGVPFRNYAGEVRLMEVGAGTRIDYTISADRRVPVVDALVLGLVVRVLAIGLVRAASKVV